MKKVSEWQKVMLLSAFECFCSGQNRWRMVTFTLYQFPYQIINEFTQSVNDTNHARRTRTLAELARGALSKYKGQDPILRSAPLGLNFVGVFRPQEYCGRTCASREGSARRTRANDVGDGRAGLRPSPADRSPMIF